MSARTESETALRASDKSWSQFTAADYDVGQWHRACLIHLHDGPAESKGQCKLPVREPDGTLNRNGVHAAASVLAGGRGGVDAPPEQKARARAAIRRLYRELDEDVPESLLRSMTGADDEADYLRVEDADAENEVQSVTATRHLGGKHNQKTHGGGGGGEGGGDGSSGGGAGGDGGMPSGWSEKKRKTSLSDSEKAEIMDHFKRPEDGRELIAAEEKSLKAEASNPLKTTTYTKSDGTSVTLQPGQPKAVASAIASSADKAGAPAGTRFSVQNHRMPTYRGDKVDDADAVVWKNEVRLSEGLFAEGGSPSPRLDSVMKESLGKIGADKAVKVGARREPRRSSTPILDSVNEPEPLEVRSVTLTEDEVSFDDEQSEPAVEPLDGWFVRSYPLDDIRVARTPDGRTVEAYAAVFGSPAEVIDKDGHYLEVIDSKAFNRAVNRAPFPPLVIYNHGLDLFGRPASGPGTVPLGEAVEVKVDGKGVFTRSRYHSGAFADEVLQAVSDGVITGQSFRGQFTRSKPVLRPGRTLKPDEDGALRTVTRQEVYPLVEYGPTPTPVYQEAAIVAVRSESLQRLRALISTPEEEAVVEAVAESLGEEADRSVPSSLMIHYQRVRARARTEGILR